MRENKVRAWIKPHDIRTTGEMVMLPLAGLQYFDFEGSWALSFVVDAYKGFWGHECYDREGKQVSYELMQYTGIKDKSGQEWYEGDIIQFKQGEQQQREKAFEDIGVIRFDRGSFFIDVRYGIFSKIQLFDIDGNFEVKRLWTGYNGRRDIYEEAFDFKKIGNIHENSELLIP
jgi:uncharacterized phage protein (TIGR01671 family)